MPQALNWLEACGERHTFELAIGRTVSMKFAASSGPGLVATKRFLEL